MHGETVKFTILFLVTRIQPKALYSTFNIRLYLRA